MKLLAIVSQCINEDYVSKYGDKHPLIVDMNINPCTASRK